MIYILFAVLQVPILYWCNLLSMYYVIACIIFIVCQQIQMVYIMYLYVNKCITENLCIIIIIYNQNWFWNRSSLAILSSQLHSFCVPEHAHACVCVVCVCTCDGPVCVCGLQGIQYYVYKYVTFEVLCTYILLIL